MNKRKSLPTSNNTKRNRTDQDSLIQRFQRVGFQGHTDVDGSNYGDENNDDQTFQQAYRCYPVSYIHKESKAYLENGDKIVMPPSALDRLASLEIDYPMLFELRNPVSERVSHCGVMEFTAEEGMVYLPDWMMKNMFLKEGDVVLIKNATLPKATYVKLQPHNKELLDVLYNPKAVLEATLRNFSCLTIGDTLVVPYNNERFSINILEAKPQEAVSIIETDCEVDFAPPLDYVEPAKLAPKVAPKAPLEVEATKEEPKFAPFTGVARRLDDQTGKELAQPASSPVLKSNQPEGATNRPDTSSGAPVEVEVPKCVPFMGVARRLDGKPCMQLPQPASSPILQSNQPDGTRNKSDNSDAPSGFSRQRAGKLMFGSNVGHVQNSTPQVPNSKFSKKEERKFKAFTGKKYSLMD